MFTFQAAFFMASSTGAAGPLTCVELAMLHHVVLVLVASKPKIQKISFLSNPFVLLVKLDLLICARTHISLFFCVGQKKFKIKVSREFLYLFCSTRVFVLVAACRRQIIIV